MALSTNSVEKLAAEVSYQDAKVEIVLEYDSKNKLPADTLILADGVQITPNLGPTETLTASDAIALAAGLNPTETATLSDTIAITMSLPKADTITPSDQIPTYTYGSLNTAALNTRQINQGSTLTNIPDVTINIV